MEKIIPILTKDLHLDWDNPRLAEFKLKKADSPKELYHLLWDEMALDEIVISITAHGFFETEPLLVTKEDGKTIVVEGNRRLSAVNIILDPSLVDNKISKNILDKITPELKQSLATLPVIELNSREDAWRFIGFKHINGAAKWNSFAKAIYIEKVHDEYGISLDEIAYQVGDTHKTVQKLYQGIRVLQQAEEWKVFDREDIAKRRLYFSHLYTAIQYEGYKEYLGIGNVDNENKNPVPVEKKNELGEVLTWLYGSKKRGIEPVIKSQNPDLRNLEKILPNTEAVSALRSGYSLEQAFEISLPSSTVFIENLLASKRHLQKAWSTVTTGYEGDKETLSSAFEFVNLADKLYETMTEIRNKKSGIGNKNRPAPEDIK